MQHLVSAATKEDHNFFQRAANFIKLQQRDDADTLEKYCAWRYEDTNFCWRCGHSGLFHIPKMLTSCRRLGAEELHYHSDHGKAVPLEASSRIHDHPVAFLRKTGPHYTFFQKISKVGGRTTKSSLDCSITASTRFLPLQNSNLKLKQPSSKFLQQRRQYSE